MTTLSHNTDQQVNEMSARFKSFRTTYTDLSQKDLAESLDISKKYMNQIENGVATPNQKIIADMGIMYGMNPEWLLTGKGQPKSDKKINKDDTAHLRAYVQKLETKVNKLEKILNQVLKLMQEDQTGEAAQ